jgi:hypothetical protein
VKNLINVIHNLNVKMYTEWNENRVKFFMCKDRLSENIQSKILKVFIETYIVCQSVCFKGPHSERVYQTCTSLHPTPTSSVFVHQKGGKLHSSCLKS